MKTNRETVYQYIFGPVPSRRLGISLGLDIIPHKTCSLNCVYCECGKTTRHTLMREEYAPTSDIISELDRYLAPLPDLDVITFAGSGEPTLHAHIGLIINHVKTNYPRYKTALLTNSSLLHLEEVRQSILSVDYILPSLDAASQPVFEKINNPVDGLSAQTIIDGIKKLALEYTGILWVEVFIIPGINDTPAELFLIKKALKEIQPTRVQINSLDRPGTCAWVQPPSTQQLNSIANFFLPLPVEIITRKFRPQESNAEEKPDVEYIINTLKRRPMTIEDIAVALKININETQDMIDELVDMKNLVAERAGSLTFYRIPQKGNAGS